MPLLINQTVCEDTWQVLDQATLATLDPLPAGDLIVPFSYYQAHQSHCATHAGRIGVQVNGDDDLTALYQQQHQFALIAVDFPTLRDGRGYSIARQLVRLGFRGELRAVGDVAHDRLAFMQRCGFTALQIPAHRYSAADLNVFSEISVDYQGSAADPRPLFRRNHG